jgi:sugar lactone lactonase YvrE
MAEPTIVANYGDLCGEGPLWDNSCSTLYWTDITGLKFYRYQPAIARHEMVYQGTEISGFALNQPGGFVVTNTQGIWLWDGQGPFHLIASEVGGHRCQMNDCIADPAGRLFAGSLYYDPSTDYALGHLIRVDTDGTAHVVDEGIHLANGLGFSPDQKIMYFTDSVARTIYAYDYDHRDGTVQHRRVFVKVPDEEGIPDGLTVDAEGFVWSAQWYGSCLVRYDPEGKPERRISIPAKQVSSLAFGGDSLTTIFVTTAGKSEPMPIMPPGYDPNSGPMGGQLFQLDLGIQGMLEYRAQIQLPV